MTAKDYLSPARQLDAAIDARLERIARLRAAGCAGFHLLPAGCARFRLLPRSATRLDRA